MRPRNWRHLSPTKTLFGRIFGWFFLSALALAGLFFYLGTMQRDSIIYPQWKRMATGDLHLMAQTGAQLARDGHLKNVLFQTAKDSEWSRDKEFPAKRVVYFYGATPAALVPLETLDLTPEEVQNLGVMARRATAEHTPVWSADSVDWIGALAKKVKRKAGAANGSEVSGYIVVLQYSQAPNWGMPFLDQAKSSMIFQHLFLTVGLMALLCFWLARSLTAPLSRLREATRRLADGDLGARVGFDAGRDDELMALGHDFDAMAQRLERLLESERRLLGDLSHELRTPLARIGVALDLGEKSGEVQTETFVRVRRESERMNALIEQIFTLTRLENAKLSRETMAQVALHDLLGEIIRDAQFEGRGGERLRAPKMEAAWCAGNANLLRSALENVIRNALRYTPSHLPVEIELQKSGEQTAQIRVRDFGAGVPDETLESLFEPFFRIESSRSREGGGVGLGLAITRRIILAHGGGVRAHNLDDGFEVEIELPTPN